MIRYIIEGLSDQGTKTDVNQDACFAGNTLSGKGEIIFVVLCDGMGGTVSGDLASASLIDEFRNWFYAKCDIGEMWNPDAYEIHNEWLNVVLECNSKIMEYSQPLGVQIGSTIVLGLFMQNSVLVMNVGDSRAYLVNDKVEKLTVDHSVVGMEIAEGRMSEEEAKLDKRNNVLTQCIGIIESIDPFFTNIRLQKGFYVFCSDGFYNKISNPELASMLNEEIDSSELLKEAISNVISHNRSMGETDDISAVVVKVDINID